MNLIQRRVNHCKFGEGIIVSQDANYVDIRFLLDGKTHTFGTTSVTGSKFFKLLEESNASETRPRKKRTTISENTQSRLVPFFDTSRKALELERDFLKDKGGKFLRIFDGRRIEISSERCIYTFSTEDELNFPEGTQISIRKANGLIFIGTILGCDDFTIIIATLENLGMEVASVEISAEPWYLLDALVERLNELEEHPTEIVRSLVCDGPSNIIRNTRKTFFTFFDLPPCASSSVVIHYVLVRHPAGPRPDGRESIFEKRWC